MSHLKRKLSASIRFVVRCVSRLRRKVQEPDPAPPPQPVQDFPQVKVLLVYGATMGETAKKRIGQTYEQHLPDLVNPNVVQALFEEDLDEYLTDKPDFVIMTCRKQDEEARDKLIAKIMLMDDFYPDIIIRNESDNSIYLHPRLHELTDDSPSPDDILENICLNRIQRQEIN